MATALPITHFSDVLCVWAYVAQRRMDQLAQEFGDQVVVDYRLASVFGFARSKLEERWQGKGGLVGYARHVREIVDRFDHVELSPVAWAEVVPTSSTPAHLLLAAIRSLEASGGAAPGAFAATAWRLRLAF